MRVLTVTLLLLPAALQAQPAAGQQVGAASNDVSSDGSVQTDDEQDTGQESEPTNEQAPSDLPDIDNQPIQPGSGGPGRFIPSEQISQDLGVSFPVDI